MPLLTIDDLPNELLDEIFSYVHPKIRYHGIKPIHTVCRRWNRPFMTQRLWNRRIPQNIDLQAKFPKLTTFEFDPSAKYFKDFNYFKGHAFLKELCVDGAALVPSILNCPRLTSLYLSMSPELFFKVDNLEIFLALLPQLENLDIEVHSNTRSDTGLIQSRNQKLVTMIQSRTAGCQKLKLKSLFPSISQVDFMLLCQLFQTSSLDHVTVFYNFTSFEQARRFVDCFPNIRSIRIYGTSLLLVPVIRFEHVTAVAVNFLSAKDVWSLSSIVYRFPNVESLVVYPGSILFDLEYSTRLIHSRMSIIGQVQPRFFPHLKTLDWSIDPSQFNYVMQELGKHCPLLTTIKMKPDGLNSDSSQGKVCVVPKVDNIVISQLITLHLLGWQFDFNSSLFRFLTRHGQLKCLACVHIIKFEDDWEDIESGQILWPNLRDIYFNSIDDVKHKQQLRDLFMKYAPNFRELVFE